MGGWQGVHLWAIAASVLSTSRPPPTSAAISQGSGPTQLSLVVPGCFDPAREVGWPAFRGVRQGCEVLADRGLVSLGKPENEVIDIPTLGRRPAVAPSRPKPVLPVVNRQPTLAVRLSLLCGVPIPLESRSRPNSGFVALLPSGWARGAQAGGDETS
jgi:hypothetical protein